MKKNKECQAVGCKKEGTEEMRGFWLCFDHHTSLVYDMQPLKLKP